MKLGLSLVALLYLVSACSSQRQEAPAPVIESASAPAEIPYSTLNLPIRIIYSDVEKLLNRELGVTLYNDDDFDNNGTDNIKLRVNKNGSIRMTGVNDYFQFTVPLDIRVEGRVKSNLGGIFAPANAPELTKAATFRIEVKLSSKLKVNPDWSMSTTTQANFRWTEDPALDLGIVKIPVGGIIEKVVSSQLGKITDLVDEEAKKYLQFKPQFEKYWNSIQDPIKLGGAVPAVLYILPESIQLAPFKPGPVSLDLRTGIKARFVMSTDTLVKSFPKIPLPDLQIAAPADNTVNLMLTAAMSYKQLTRIARQNLNGKEFIFEEGKHKILIEDIEISGKDTTLQAKVQLKGSTKAGLFRKKLDGIYYFVGTPYYDAEKQEIRVKNFDFDVKSRDLLLKSAEWLFQSNFRKLVEEQMKYSLSNELKQLRQSAESVVNKPFSKEIALSGRILRLEPTEVRFDSSQVVLYVNTVGMLSLRTYSE